MSLANFSSQQANLTCGVPQGSNLAPTFFSIYMLPLSQVISRHHISCHFYADDSQLYRRLSTDDSTGLDSLKTCLGEIKEWMSQNQLQLNETKSEFILFGPPTSVTQITSSMGSLSALVKPCVRNLGVLFDSDLNFNQQVRAVVQACFFQLRIIAKIKTFLSPSDLQKVIYMFIFSRLDYCNSLYSGLPDKTIYPLQLVQNAAARLLSGTRMRDSISPVLASLHWLRVKQRIKFKTLMFTYKALHGLAPAYLEELVVQSSSDRDLRSNNQLTLKMPRSNLKTKGDRAFAVMAPTLWNSL